MDTNNNAGETTNNIREQSQNSKLSPSVTIKQEVKEAEQEPQISNQHEIELHAEYEASDILGRDSGTQTPIEDDKGRLTLATNQVDNMEAKINKELHRDNNEAGKTGVICVKESESDGVESIEIELESDNSLLLTSLTSLYPEATGLKYRHPETNTLRGLKLVDAKFVEPTDGWASVSHYICVCNKGQKRKNDDDEEDTHKNKQAKTDEVMGEGGSDLVVLGLPWTTTEESMKTYFQQYGEVTMVQVKTDPKTGKSRGFGFVRFAKSTVHSKLLSSRHFIDGRWCDVRVPLSKAEADATKAAQLSRKIFVGRLTENITTDDLRDYFSAFGTLTDVFIPKPFRKFAFVTCGTADMAQSIYKHKHVINGTAVEISEAKPRDNAPGNFNYSGPQGGNPGGYGNNYPAHNIHPFNANYNTHQPPSHNYNNKANASGFAANTYQNNRKTQHQQQSYYQMPSYNNSGPSSSSMDTQGYINAHNDYTNFGGTGGSSSSVYSNQQAGGSVNGQYYKVPQHPVMTPQHPNHGSNYPQQYPGHFSRSSYNSVWK